MIAIDTNILLRYLLQDDRAQSPKATALFSGSDKILITDVVLVETIWTLKGKRYQVDKVAIVDVLHLLFAEPQVTFEDEQVVWSALQDYTLAKPVKVSGKQKQADFSDALIVNKARKSGQKIGEDNVTVFTFDKAALVIEGTKQP